MKINIILATFICVSNFLFSQSNLSKKFSLNADSEPISYYPSYNSTSQIINVKDTIWVVSSSNSRTEIARTSDRGITWRKYEFGNTIAPQFTDRNSRRMPTYHRMDFAATFKNKDKPNRKYFWDLNLSIYNVYNRHNAWIITIRESDTEPGKMQAYQTYLFPIIPSLTYNFRF